MSDSNVFDEFFRRIIRGIRIAIISAVTIFGAFTIIDIVESGGFDSLSKFVLYCLERYRYLVDGIFGFVDVWLRFIVRLIEELFYIRIPISEYWVDMFALMALYMSIHARDALRGSDRKWIAAPFRFFWGILVAFVVCIFSSWLPAAGNSSLLSASAACFFGVIGYRIGFSAQMAYDLSKREDPTPFIETFLSKMRDSWIVIVPAAILILLFLAEYFANFEIFTIGIELFVFFFVLSYCAFFHLYLSFRKYAENLYDVLLKDFEGRNLKKFRAMFGVLIYFRSKPIEIIRNWLGREMKKGNFEIGIRIFFTILASIFLIFASPGIEKSIHFVFGIS